MNARKTLCLLSISAAVTAAFPAFADRDWEDRVYARERAGSVATQQFRQSAARGAAPRYTAPAYRSRAVAPAAVVRRPPVVHRPAVVERRVVVERPVYVDRPVVVQRPVYVERSVYYNEPQYYGEPAYYGNSGYYGDSAYYGTPAVDGYHGSVAGTIAPPVPRSVRSSAGFSAATSDRGIASGRS